MRPVDELPDVRDGMTTIERAGLRAIAGADQYRKATSLLGIGPPGPDDDPVEIDDGYRFPDYSEHYPIYGALVALEQPFTTRYPLVDGRGNLGSIDDDPASHPAWVELRLGPVALALMEPQDEVFGGPFPSLLANGTRRGLARFLPHNLRELAAGITARLDEPTLDLDGFMAHVPGPDFPGGGQLLGGDDVRDAYLRGRGEVRLRATSMIEPPPWPGTGKQIVFSTVPFLVTKGGDGGVIGEIADAVEARSLGGVANIVDQSNRSGPRLAVEIHANADAMTVRRTLYAQTRLESGIEVRALASVDGAPTTMPMLALVDRYLADQRAWLRAAGVAEPLVDDTIRARLAELAKRFGGPRRTEIVASFD